MNPLALLAALMLAPPASGNALAPATTDAQSREARRLIESHNGAGARGCLTERQVYEAYHRVDPGLAWNPDNPVDWYIGRNTLGLADGLINDGYGEVSRAWNAAVNGTDFETIGAPCRAAKTPRALASCLNDQVGAYFKAHPSVGPGLGGACKMYAATVVAVAAHFPAVTRQASIVASLEHAINRLTIRDAQVRDHEFLIDALNNMVVQIDGKNGCPEEGTLAASSKPATASPEAAAETDALRRQRDASERVGRVEPAAPTP